LGVLFGQDGNILETVEKKMRVEPGAQNFELSLVKTGKPLMRPIRDLCMDLECSRTAAQASMLCSGLTDSVPIRLPENGD